MDILLTGASGQLGRELRPLLAGMGRLVCTGRPAGALAGDPGDFLQLDLADDAALLATLDRLQPDLVVNAAAYTAVDRAEAEPALAHRVNALAPGLVAQWAARHGKAMVHFSTDYVFDGECALPCTEQDAAAPLNAYGASKLAGERAVAASGCRHLVLRTSWLYASHGRNFVRTMLDLAKRKDRVRVVDDQVGCPTWARNLAQYAVTAINAGLLEGSNPPAGLYHCCDADAMSWHAFARQVFEVAVRQGILETMPVLEAITSAEFPQAARRPRWSVLDTTAAQRELGIRPRGLVASLETCLMEYREHG